MLFGVGDSFQAPVDLAHRCRDQQGEPVCVEGSSDDRAHDPMMRIDQHAPSFFVVAHRPSRAGVFHRSYRLAGQGQPLQGAGLSVGQLRLDVGLLLIGRGVACEYARDLANQPA